MADKRKRPIDTGAMTDEEYRKYCAAGHRERMRALVDRDPEFLMLTPVDVLEYALFFGIPQKDTKLIAHRLLERFGDLHGVMCAPILELKSIKGMTESAARLLRLILPMSRLCLREHNEHEQYINTPSDALDKLNTMFMGHNEEMIVLMCLDINDKLIRTDVIEKGTYNSVVIDIPKIIQHALNAGAAKILLGHNHPAGSMVPSLSDIQATMDLAVTARGANILLYDHVIISMIGFVSLYNNGVIAKAFARYDQIHGTHFAANLAKVHEYNSMQAEYRLAMRDGGHKIIAEPLNPHAVDFCEKTGRITDDTTFDEFLDAQMILRDRIDIEALLGNASGVGQADPAFEDPSYDEPAYDRSMYDEVSTTQDTPRKRPKSEFDDEF